MASHGDEFIGKFRAGLRSNSMASQRKKTAERQVSGVDALAAGDPVFARAMTDTLEIKPGHVVVIRWRAHFNSAAGPTRPARRVPRPYPPSPADLHFARNFHTERVENRLVD